MSTERLTEAVIRLAIATEQLTLAVLDKPIAEPKADAGPKLAPVSPQPEPPHPAAQWEERRPKAPDGACPTHHLAWKYVPPGTNKAGKQYDGFWACPEWGCREKPR